MEQESMCIDEQELSSDGQFPCARGYQIHAYMKAMKQNTIVFLETGSGKTLIAVMLLRSYANVIRKPSNAMAVFLVPQVVLVHQQSEVIKMHTDLKVGEYWGDMNVDLWDASTWLQEYEKHEVLVMTPAILLNTLRHGFLKIQMIKLMIFDECHHARQKHPYACIMKEFYHKSLMSGGVDLPRILGMTASPINSKVLNSREEYLKRIISLENMMDSKVYTVVNESIMAKYIPIPMAKVKQYDPVGIPHQLLEGLNAELNHLVQKHNCSLGELDIEKSSIKSLARKISKICSNFKFCLEELGLWLAFKAAENYSLLQPDIITWGNLSAFSKTTIRKFSRDARDIFSSYIPPGPSWSIGNDLRTNEDAGFLTRRVISLIDSLLEYRYFQSYPSFCIDKELQTCTLHLPRGSPLQPIKVEGSLKFLKQMACLEACRQLHQVGALTDNLIPDAVEEASALENENVPYNDDNVVYFPSQLVGHSSNNLMTSYHCYLINMELMFDYEISAHDIVFLFRNELESNIANMRFSIGTDRGNVSVHMDYIGVINLSPEHVNLGRNFQVSLLKILLRHGLDKADMDIQNTLKSVEMIDYLVLPSSSSHAGQIDWHVVRSVLCMKVNRSNLVNCDASACSRQSVHTHNSHVCCCALQNSIVHTPHNGKFYIIDGFFKEVNGLSFLPSKSGPEITYKEYFKTRGVELRFVDEPLVKARHMFQVPSFLIGPRKQKEKYWRYTSVELPPEVCSIVMSPISISTVYSFSFVPVVIHRIQSMLIANDLKKPHSDYCLQNGLQIVSVPVDKVLEAITTRKCQEDFDMESLETLGDSFLKYMASKWLFVTYQNHHEGLLSLKKDKIVSNSALCKLGCDRKLPGFIRMDPFDPKDMLIPGERLSDSSKVEVISDTVSMYVTGSRKIRGKIVADVVEALIGAYLSSGGEKAALSIMDWLGIKLDFMNSPYERHFPIGAEGLINLHHLQDTLNYLFHDSTLLVEALTHGSYMVPEIPRSYQRLEFLGDAVLDYVVTDHLYNKYPGMSPGMLTDMRSASVNNDCYAHAAIKANLHKHILYFSRDLFKQMEECAYEFEQQSAETSFGWTSEISFPKVLGDVIESLAGAIFVDCGYQKDIVFECIRPLLEPLITPKTLKLHPVRELMEFCQKWQYQMIKSASVEDGVPSVTIEVITDTAIYRHTSHAGEKKLALKLACKEVLTCLKEARSPAAENSR